ncbi:MAG TPA: sigma factor, partial [Chloroflexota bacterium]|nr:sigma factor [Chloroflexota bacterium]
VAQAVTAGGELSLREQALTGDEAAFEALIGPLVEPALRLAHSMLGDRWEAEDATQEAITRAWRKRPASAEHAGPALVPGHRHQSVPEHASDQVVQDGAPGRGVPAPPLRHREIERVDLARALAPASQDRQALFLHFYLDLPTLGLAEVDIKFA